MPETLEKTLAALPLRFPGAGGAVAVLKDGQVLARNAWGYADLERRIPFTPATMFLVCSISKQFTLATTLLATNLDRAPDTLESALAARLPLMRQRPGALHLAHNQSGLRDYWALTALSGSPVEAPFTESQARRLIGRTETLHFAPGSRYSYSNHNFRLLGDMVAEREGAPLGELMRKYIFDRAGMPTARLNADTSQVPGFTVGYEGGQAEGFRPAVNRITWTGDAGVSASLDDMIAWERHIDATRDNPESIYQRLAAPVAFTDGANSGYGFGLARGEILGRQITGHGGGLRGWRSFRFYAQGERISVVVLFNHMADPRAAALQLFAAALGEDIPAPGTGPQVTWGGRYLEPETGLAARIEALPDGRVVLHYVGSPETLAPVAEGHAAGPVRLRERDGALWLTRGQDNLHARLEPVSGEAARDVAGTYRSAELGAELVVTEAGGQLYAACAGELGEGAMVPLVPHAGDTWLMPCPRALDFSAPGDWTLAFRREGGRVAGVRVGCWLARGIDYARA
jgi:D-aminopeptidase